MKDRDGKRLSDAFLVKVCSTEYPWLPAVYENLSGYIHFSGPHIFDSVVNVGNKDNAVSFEVSDTDLKFPKFSWVEIFECFREATEMLAKFLHV